MDRTGSRVNILSLFFLLAALPADLVLATPPVPAGLNAGTPVPGQVNLYWTPVPVATSYTILRQLQGPPSGSPVTIDTLPADVLPASGTPVYRDDQVTNGRTYLYQVWGTDNSGDGSPASLLTSPYLAPRPVAPVTVRSIHNRALDLSWGMPDSSLPVSLYQVYRFADQSPTPSALGYPVTTISGAAVPVTAVATTAFNDPGADPALASAYYYYVLAVDDSGVTGAAPVSSTVAGFPPSLGLPGPVTLDSALSTSSLGVSLFWNASLSSEQVSGYQVLRNSTPVAAVTYVPGTPTVTYVDSAVTESWSANVYSIQATNPNGSTYSDSVTQYLVPPGTVTVVVTPNATSNSVTISWKPGLPGTFGLIGYRVYKGLWGPPAVNPTPGATFTPTPTPITIISFDPTVGYTVTPVVDSPIQDHMGYWVQPVDGVSQIGPSGIPAPPYFKLAPTPPSSLQVAATPNANNTFSISWAPGAPGFFGLPNHYELDRTVLAVTSPTPVATVPYGQNSVSDVVSGFGSGSTVIYGLKLVDAQGNPSDLLQQVSNAMTLTGVVAAPARPTVLPFSGSISGIQYAWLMDPLADGVTAYQVYPNDWPTLTPVAAPVTVFASGPATFVFNPSPTPWVPNTYYLVAQNTVTVSSPVTLSGIPVTNYQVLANVVPGSKSVSVNWDLVPPAGTTTPSFDHYGIYRSRNPNSGYSLIATVGYPVTVYQDTTPTVTPGIDYYYQVTVRSGQSSESPVDPALGAGQPATVHLWPNVPTGVVAQAAATQTTLQWLANAGTEGVTAYEATQNGGSPMTVVSGPASFSTAFPETPGTLSVYRVIARNPSGDSDPCQPISILVPNAVTLTTVVNPPPQLAPPSSLNSSVSLLGLGYSGPVSAFKLYRQVTINGTPVISLAGSVSAGITVFNDPQPTPGYVNLYRAAGTGSGLEVGQASAPSVAVTLWPEVPIFSASGNGSAITIAWNGPVGDAPATGWNVYRNIYPTLTPAPVTTLSGGQTYVDAAVSQGTAYLYWMGSSNPAGNSGLSSPQTAMALDPPSLSITPLPEKNILSWSAITPIPGSPVTGYMVFRAVITPSATPTYSNLTGTILEPLSNTTYADSVTDGITYAYKVAGASSNGVLGAFSTPVTTTAAVQPVSMFTAVSGDRLVQLRWSYQGNPNITYILQKRLGTAPATQFQTLRTGFTGNNYDDSSVVDKNFYVYQITSVDPAGNTSTPVQAIALPAKAPVLSSSAVTLSQNTSNAVTNGNTLSWAGADQAGSFDPTMMYPLGGYAVYRSVDGGGVYQWVRTVAVTFQGGYPASPVSWTDNLTPDQLVNGNTNSYLIQAFDSPPDLPVPLSQAVTEGLVHSTSYAPVIAHTISPNTALDRNALRPFGASNERIVNIRFVVSGQGRVNIKVYNLGGTYITELINADYAPGIYWATWDGHNRSGDLVASGVYLISTESPGHQEFSKIAVIK